MYNPDVRKFTNKLIAMAEEGLISWQSIARACLSWMSEYEVKEMSIANEFYEGEEEE